MALIIKSDCIDVKDGICTTCCPVDCIYEGERMFYIHPIECIECGMCESICPVDAIRYSDEVSAADEEFIRINNDVFYEADGQLIAPGGWRKGDAPIRDHPTVRDFPAQASPSPTNEDQTS